MTKHGIKYINGTTEERIRWALRLNVLQGQDLDWDTILDPVAVELLYDDTGSMKRLGDQLGISENRARELLVIHGIELNQQGGAYQGRRTGRHRTTTREDMLQIGRDYGFNSKDLAILNAHASDRVRTCAPQCPLGLFCWDGGKVVGRRKKHNCGLRDHLVATGLLGDGNGQDH